MKYGAWIHTGDDLSLEEQAVAAKEVGLSAIRSYSLSYAEQAAPVLRRAGLQLLAGMHIDSERLVEDWRSQVRLDDLARYHELDVPLDGICVGNELREGGDAPDQKRFTARLSFGLANVLDIYRRWLDDQGLTTPLTYAMEGIVLDTEGRFYEWLWPLVDACDSIGLNLYPMGNEAWFTYDAFEESRRFLQEPKVRHNRLALFELHLRRVLAQVSATGKRLILTETGFPSAVGFHIEEDKWVIPQHDKESYGRVMTEFLARIRQADEDYDGAIQSLYFYEWRDNLHHPKIWNVEQSPIHVAFGLCDREGKPKMDLKDLLGEGAA
jgi:hypothetical protein